MSRLVLSGVGRRIPINIETGELGGELSGHALGEMPKCELPEEVKAFRDEYIVEGARVGWYRSTMPLSGTSGFAVTLGEYVLAYYPVLLH